MRARSLVNTCDVNLTSTGQRGIGGRPTATKPSPALPVDSGPSMSEADGELEGPHVAAKNRRHPHARAAARSIDRAPATDERVDSNASGSANGSDAHIGPKSSLQFSHGSV